MPLIASVPQRFAGRWVLNETRPRSVVKTVSWRVTGSGSTFLITYLITGNLGMAGSVAAVQIVANTLLYYLHERVWNMISWGRKK